MPRCIVLHPDDNVATLIDAAREGEPCTFQGELQGQVIAAEAIAFGHKVCIVRMEPDAPVRKYGQVIGRATRAIRPGEHAHVHNFDSARARGDLARERAA